MSSMKRKKSSISCVFCRRRKVKCDMGQPCSSCVKYGNLDCNYLKVSTLRTEEEAARDYKDRIEKEIVQLHLRLSNLKSLLLTEKESSSHDHKSSHFSGVGQSYQKEVIVFHDSYMIDYKESFLDRGNLTWLALVSIDPYLKAVWRRLMKSGDARRIYDWAVLHSSKKMAMRYCAVIGETLGEDVKFNRRNPSESAQNGTEGNISANTHLKNLIQDCIPKWRVLSYLYQRFFSVFGSAFPIFVRKDVEKNFERVLDIGTFAADDVPRLRISEKADFAHLGIFLVFMRLSYLSLFTITGDYVDSEDTKCEEFLDVINNPITVDAIELANICFGQFDVSNCRDVHHLQLAMFLYNYQKYAPEITPGVANTFSYMSISVLFEMAHSLGLERDPENNEELRSNELQVELRRRLWFFLLILDIDNSMTTGVPPCSVMFSFDTKLPQFPSKFDQASCLNNGIQHSSANTRSHFEFFFSTLRMITDVRGSKLSDVMDAVSKHEAKFVPYDQISESLYSDKVSPFRKILRVDMFFKGGSFLLSLYFHFFIYHERKYNFDSCCFYFDKIIGIVREFMKATSDIIENGKIIFNSTTDLLIHSSLLTAIQKSLIIMSAMIIRTKICLTHLKLRSLSQSFDYSHQIYNLGRLEALFCEYYDQLLETSQKFSDSNFRSFMSNVQDQICNILSSTEFVDDYKNGENAVVFSSSTIVFSICNKLESLSTRENNVASSFSCSTYSTESIELGESLLFGKSLDNSQFDNFYTQKEDIDSNLEEALFSSQDDYDSLFNTDIQW